MRRISALLVVLCLLLTGCWDNVELENRGFVVSMGIDKQEGGIALTLTVPDAAAIAGKDDGGERLLLHGQGASLAAAIRDAGSGIGKTLFFGQTKLVVLSTAVLFDADMLSQVLDTLDRGSEWSRKLIILAADENLRAADVLGAESPGEPLVGTFVASYYKNGANAESMAVKTDLEHVVHALNASGDTVLPRAAVEDKKIVLEGAVVLRRGMLAGWLGADEARGLMWWKGEGENALVRAEWENIPVPFHVTHCTRSLSFGEDEEGLLCRLRIHAAGSVESLALSPDMLIGDDTLDALEAVFADEIAKEAVALFEILRDEYAADALDWREELYKQAPDLYRRYANDWENAFAGMRLETEVDVRLQR